MKLRRRSGGPATPAEDEIFREIVSRTMGADDAREVLAGERVVRAILAHRAPLTFAKLAPALDLGEYLDGFREVAGDIVPPDRRSAEPRDSADTPRRRSTDPPS